MKWLRVCGILLALMFVGLSIFNASWLAAAPAGSPKLLAHDGVWQDDGRRTISGEAPQMKRASELGAVMVGVDAAQASRPDFARIDRAARRSRILFKFQSDDPAEADTLVASLEKAGRAVQNNRDGFYGTVGPINRLRELHPEAWAFTAEEGLTCTGDYRLMGWLGNVPVSCRDARTAIIALDNQFALPGWPNRMMARMAKLDVNLVVVASNEGNRLTGLDLPEQLGEIPGTYNGFIWVDDIYVIGPALRSALNDRTPDEEEALAAALERRRQARE